MKRYTEVVLSLLHAENFGEKLEEVIKKDLGMNLKDFAIEAGIPLSTLYKIISANREPNLSTLRKILNAIFKFLESEEEFIAVVASRVALNQLLSYEIEVDGKKINVKEYPANSFDEAIVSAIRAERDGAKAIVCAPILSPILEKILRVPIVTIIPKSDLESALRIAALKSKKT
ncbi:MAG: helix-turn-helix domain-containing protein [Archaeoglobales archaeon]|nr:helix-turn-helix domain-containing protein [Archaeoglobales archaeon]